ncbi:MAG TPA: CDP-glycerol glycerophosphotransferase family protein [Candidatus Limnocylindrales bacterium]
MSRLEYALASRVLRLFGWFFARLPMVPGRVVLASPRISRLEGNLAFIHAELRARDPALRPVVLLDTYGYGLRAKASYLLRTIRGMYYLRTSPLIVVDNAYLPLHVAPHDRATRVVQVWHAVSAVKRFGLDTVEPPAEPESTFLHRYYDDVVVSSDRVRAIYAAALRTPIDRVLALGTPRTDFFFDPAAMAAARRRLLGAHPALADRRVVLYAPTLRGRGSQKASAAALDPARLRVLLPPDHALVLKVHPNVDPASVPTEGYDVVFDPRDEINELLALTDILITDYSSAIFEFALLRRPIVLLTGDLAEYARDPGVCLDFATEMIGTQVVDTDAAAAAILEGRFDLSGYDTFIERHLGACDGHASKRFVDWFAATFEARPQPRRAP